MEYVTNVDIKLLRKCEKMKISNKYLKSGLILIISKNLKTKLVILL